MSPDPDRRRDLLVAELEDAVGEEAVDRADLDVDRALERRPSKLSAAFVSSRLLLIVVGSALLVVAAIAALAVESWIVLPLALVVHALLAAVVVGSALVLASDAEKPAATTEAALEAEGVSDPSGALNDLVEQVADGETGVRGGRG
jgi:hypothetical protein